MHSGNNTPTNRKHREQIVSLLLLNSRRKYVKMRKVRKIGWKMSEFPLMPLHNRNINLFFCFYSIDSTPGRVREMALPQ